MVGPSRAKVRRWSPTPEQAEYLRATEATNRFLQNISDDLRQQYEGQWIAAKNCEIIDSAPTRAELSAKLGGRHDPTILLLRLEKGVTIRCRRPS
jgi:hypothetical protein